MAGGHPHEPGGPLGDLGSAVHRLDPRAKLVGLVGVTVVAVSTPYRAWPVWLGCALALVAVALAARVPAGAIWRRSRVVLPVILAASVFIPFAREGEEAFRIGPLVASAEGLEVLVAVTVKAAIGTASAVLLTATTAVPALLRALEAMRVPRLLTLVAAFMYRYLFVIADELGRMRIALAARAYRPRHLLAAGPLGRVVAALFLRCHGRGERVYLAMLARGYSGRMPDAEPLRLGRADVAFVAAIALVLVPLRAAVGIAT